MVSSNPVTVGGGVVVKFGFVAAGHTVFGRSGIQPRSWGGHPDAWHVPLPPAFSCCTPPALPPPLPCGEHSMLGLCRFTNLLGCAVCSAVSPGCAVCGAISPGLGWNCLWTQRYWLGTWIPRGWTGVGLSPQRYWLGTWVPRGGRRWNYFQRYWLGTWILRGWTGVELSPQRYWLGTWGGGGEWGELSPQW